MSRADVTTRAAAEAGAARHIVVAGGWLRVPSAAPGVFRVRPLHGEATASYTQRLADAYWLTLPQLLDGASIPFTTMAPHPRLNSTSTTTRPSTLPS